MAEIVKRKKAMSVSPLKSSQPIGASLAFAGFNRAIPMMHGSQGCTAFGKVFFVRHFREPIPLQTTAMDQVSAVMGADDNVVQGLKAIAEKSKPALIGVPTTGLSETQGTDVKAAVKKFYADFPEYKDIAVIPVNTPDFTGSMETGFAAAIKATIDALVPEAEKGGTVPGNRKKQINVLVGALLTPGDLEVVKETIEMFGLRPVVIPDIGDSLDGHLTENDFSPITVGGTPVNELATLGDAKATFVIGRSIGDAADILAKRTGVPDYRFDTLMGLEAFDEFVSTLSEISEQDVPEKLERQRAQLQDAMLDCHFMTGFARVAIALDPDLLYVFSHLIQGMGGEVVAAVAPGKASVLTDVAAKKVKIGDLEDMEKLARENHADLVIGNSHATASAERLGLPILKTGFPLYDIVGGYQRTWVGYQGTKQALFDLANIFLNNNHHEIKPYHSVYAQKPEYREEDDDDGIRTANAGS